MFSHNRLIHQATDTLGNIHPFGKIVKNRDSYNLCQQIILLI